MLSCPATTVLPGYLLFWVSQPAYSIPHRLPHTPHSLGILPTRAQLPGSNAWSGLKSSPENVWFLILLDKSLAPSCVRHGDGKVSAGSNF